MSIEGNWSRRISRRTLLSGAAGATGLILISGVPVRAKPSGVPSGLPTVTHGVQSGDVTASSAVVWARADRPSRMFVEVAATESFRRPKVYKGPITDSATDFTAQLDLSGLPQNQEVFYRVRFEDDRTGRSGEPVAGYFRTASEGPRDVSFVWGGDTAGQGWGINPDFGGMRLYETMRSLGPDFFIHSGDTVYSDGPIMEKVVLPDGTVWRNVVTKEKSKVAETLAEFRGNQRYNLLDENVRRFNAEVPVFAQWDDHETTNNWYPGEILDDPRYTQERRVDVLSARANRAFHEYMPVRQVPSEEGRVYRKIPYGPTLDIFFLDMRTYRGPNSTNDQTTLSPESAILGQTQLEWLKAGLAASTATWKVIASDMPIGLVVRDGPTDFEAVANARDGAALGRELEIADLLSFIKQQGIKNTAWFTADVHYTAAHYYDPNGAAFQDFDPFWEFVSGPLNAGTFGPNALDATFGPKVVYQRAADRPNQPPSDGLQFFGHVKVAGDTGVMTVSLKDLAGHTLYSVDLQPDR
ncbi:MAG TPA: alkaline phosphatase D family protein [Rubrobacter sp.]